MGFFFRRSTRVGPFRFNFSKSGVGASLGIKGARLTLTPRGTTYITVGSGGFYYRETLSRREHILSPTHLGARPSDQPSTDSVADTIQTAISSDLVDSSGERLIQRLNERAKMFNPAWVLYIAALTSLATVAMLPSVPLLPGLPEVTAPLGTERSTIDEYSALTARYGEPDSILVTEADPLAPLVIGTARYSTAHVKVVFVQNGCASAYNEVMKIRGDGLGNTVSIKREIKKAGRCLPVPDSGWAIVGYQNSTGSNSISAEAATLRLDAIRTRKTTLPILEAKGTTESSHQAGSRQLSKKQLPTPPAMRSKDPSRVGRGETRQDVQMAETRTFYFRTGLLTVALVLFVAGVLAHQKNSEKRKTRLFYELDETEQRRHSVVQESFGILLKCRRIWRIESESATVDLKRNAGASSLVRRAITSVTTLTPPRVETNVQVPCINLGRSQLYFLPDTILYRDGSGFGAISYSDFRLEQGFTRFIESGEVPSDATVVDHTWQYVNKNGGPDRRFSNNRQLPILRLGVLVFNSSKGLNIQLNTSDPEKSVGFTECWRTQFELGGKPFQRRPPQSPPRREEPVFDRRTTARKTLGVDSNATEADIAAAYRRLAQMYHPDKVAGLAPEFQNLAETRMREINSAFEALRRNV